MSDPLHLPGAPLPATQVGRYTIVREVGRGGMATVYEAVHADLRKRVALKLMHRGGRAGPNGVARFLREARAAAQIRHPHIVDVFDIGNVAGVPFLVMDFLEGPNLNAWLSSRARLSADQIADLMLPIISAVCAAHDAGIVHRDLKPANIVVTETPLGTLHPTVVDFGISRMQSDESSEQLTDSGTLLGTLPYMAPELLQGARLVTELTDQYALGVILYECATGIRPFQAATPYELMHAIATGMPKALSQVEPRMPHEFEAVVVRAMQRNPAKRFPSVHALGSALLGCAGGDSRALWGSQFGGPTAPAASVAGKPTASPTAGTQAAPRQTVAQSPRSAERRSADRLVGRAKERDLIEQVVAGAVTRVPQRLLMFVGDAGIGKTRLLEEVAEVMRRSGGRVFYGRAFEAEMVSPYGPWVEAFRSLLDLPGGTVADLDPLLQVVPSLGAGHGDKNQFFSAVASSLAALAKDGKPVAVLLDDLHWFDEGSIGLLHFVARALLPPGVVLASAVRAADLANNAVALRALRSLEREKSVQEVRVGSLDDEATAELVRSVGVDLDPTAVFSESEGVPLFALEIARAMQQGEAPHFTRLEALIEDRLHRLEGSSATVLPWAAALGRSFQPELLGDAAALPVHDLLEAIEDLERRGIVRVAPLLDGTQGYDFAHDLLRQVAYDRVSLPRRRLMHRAIARALASRPDPAGRMAGELAHHAALGGEDELCAKACLSAAERCLRVFANTEAAALADRGLALARAFAREVRLPLQIRLLRVSVLSCARGQPAQELEAEISQFVIEARASGMSAEVALGLYVISELYWNRGSLSEAKEVTLQAAEAGRAADPGTTGRTLANTGRCLAMLEQDMAQAWGMLHEAVGLLGPRGIGLPSLPLGLGILHHHRGETDLAMQLLLEAHRAAASEGDRWLEWECLVRVTKLDLEQNRPRDALHRCPELMALAIKMGSGGETVVTSALEALASLQLGERDAESKLEGALVQLREIDSKTHLGYILSLVAERDLSRGDLDSALRRAREAIEASEIVGRKNDLARARTVAGRVALQRGDVGEAKEQVLALRDDLSKPLGIAAHVRAPLVALADELGLPVVTAAPVDALASVPGSGKPCDPAPTS